MSLDVLLFKNSHDLSAYSIFVLLVKLVKLMNLLVLVDSAQMGFYVAFTLFELICYFSILCVL